MSKLFDFTDLSDLDKNLQGRLSGGGRVNPNIAAVAEIVKAGAGAGMPTLTISMIEAVWFRMGKDAISQQAMRNALNGAVKANLVAKASRQTYAVPGPVGQVADITAIDDATDEGDAPVELTAVAVTAAVGVDPLA